MMRDVLGLILTGVLLTGVLLAGRSADAVTGPPSDGELDSSSDAVGDAPSLDATSDTQVSS
jgi:hypothetical protein